VATPILTPPVDFRDSALVDDNIEWQRGFLNDCFWELASLDDLTCDIDMTEHPEWSNKFINKCLWDIPPSSFEPGSLDNFIHADTYKNQIMSKDDVGLLDQLSPNTSIILDNFTRGLIVYPTPTILMETDHADNIEV
jgi:hypothetical protein